ncbi:hypothetical protein KS4_09640 [Poriferisphaera corsica]|uniref:DUF3592 domain-containing protein n=1 Tax=Poriferisphaera corsica TaxID=2528020 RepID=A0A517YRT2_9BACT|nr:DUF3592 domain-containing protein [Poriferisphaera corsica]QDU32925.1 hypothetical protein KS4_09640 [Poriferisphaera corsica]
MGLLKFSFSKLIKAYMILVGSVMILGLVGGVAVKLYEIQLAWRSDTFQSVEGHVESQTVILSSALGARNQYEPVVRYKYKVEGKEYTGSRIALAREVTFRKREDAKQWLRENIRENKRIEVFYQPNDHSVSTLNTAADLSMYSSLFTALKFASLGIVIAAIFLIPRFKRLFKVKKHQANKLISSK